MVELDDNVMNRESGPDALKFKLWSNAGLMLSYRCSSRCRCCYVFSGPQAGRPETEMSVEQAISYWGGIRELAGEKGKVHLTGGEPFMDYDRLRKILQRGCAQYPGSLEKIETNAYWCTEPGIVRRRLEELAKSGLTKLQISTDIYHQEYIPIERVRLAVSIAAEIFGEKGVQVRWRDFLAEPVILSTMNEADRQSAIASVLARRGERLLGRAAEELITCFPSRDYDDFAEDSCAKRILGARHVHIDGAGNVFSGTCIGICLGNLKRDRSVSLASLWRSWNYRSHPVFRYLIEHGPYGLSEHARSAGYRPESSYASKCHLCYSVRKYLYKTGRYDDLLCPGACYGL